MAASQVVGVVPAKTDGPDLGDGFFDELRRTEIVDEFEIASRLGQRSPDAETLLGHGEELDELWRFTWLSRDAQWIEPGAEPETVSVTTALAAWHGRVSSYVKQHIERAAGDLKPEQWIEAVRRFRYRCAYCEAAAKLHLDHVVPASRGGKTTVANVVPACWDCNSRKRARRPEEWLRPVQLRDFLARWQYGPAYRETLEAPA